MSEAVERVVSFYENLQPDTLHGLCELYAQDARFKDPFNDVVGIDAIQRIFEHMFASLESPRFAVTARIGDESRCALEWVFRFRLSGRAFEVRGMSVLMFDNDRKVLMHRDYWDPAEEVYARLPVLGAIFRCLQRRMSATAP